MMIKPLTKREKFKFPDEVRRRFSFLDSLGFSYIDGVATLVCFKSSEFFVNIYHGRQSYEIGLEIGLESDENIYSISEISQLLGIEGSELYRNYVASTKEAVAEGVRQLAETFQECVDAGLLEGSSKNIFARLEKQRSERAKNYALQTQLSQALKKAEQAWERKDFGKVVFYLEPFRDHLSPSNLKKLSYAEKQEE